MPTELHHIMFLYSLVPQHCPASAVAVLVQTAILHALHNIFIIILYVLRKYYSSSFVLPL